MSIDVGSGGAGGSATYLTARKTALETVNNSTALQNDDHLLVAVAANKVYFVQVVVIYNTSAATDLKAAFTGPAGATFDWRADRPDSPLRAIGDTQQMDGSGSQLSGIITGRLVTAGTAGTLQFQWAQFAAAVTDTHVYAGSFMTLQEASA